ncbi:MAG: arsenate reductase ArsC [Spirochaetaceae bacterium]|nr:arsenate reductase ArsC [Spirochaetaceae bacterium]
MTTRRFEVLFLCTGNSARSLLAEALLRALGGDRFGAWSAGSRPTGRAHPLALEVLRERGHDVAGLRSKSWDEFARPDAPRLDFVFTVCDNAAGEVCPVWPGQPMTAHWGIEDPAAFEGDDALHKLRFVRAYHELRRRIELFTSLPVEALDRMSLQRRLDEIGAIDRNGAAAHAQGDEARSDHEETIR